MMLIRVLSIPFQMDTHQLLNPMEDTQLERGDLLIDFKVKYVDVFSVEGDICNATNGQHLVLNDHMMDPSLEYSTLLYICIECLSVSVCTRVLHQLLPYYTTTEREALAVVSALKEFYPYVHGFSCRLITDHNPLTSLRGLKDIGGRLTRWLIFL